MGYIPHRKAKCQQWHTHDSVAEAKRCNELHALQSHGDIRSLKIQEEWLLLPPQKFPGTEMKSERGMVYTCDFDYWEDNLHIVEDVKSNFTKKERDYVRTRKLFKHLYCGENSCIIFRETIR